ncbi:MAG: sulfotransferase family 2 domain-containing protein [Chloroflexi bacterium]|nr:sulfotransferase family 2 domain-containing protein [Chloroflexota bacterium]
MDDTLLIYLHIPKTGGETLRWTIENQFPVQRVAHCYEYRVRQRLLALDDAHKRRLRLVVGHYPFGLHNHFPQPTRYVTMLRDPVKHFISIYHFQIDEGKQHFMDTPFAAFVEQVAEGRIEKRFINNMIDNKQTRWLNEGFMDPFMAERDSSWPESLPAADVDEAIAHLEARFPVFGLTGRFHASIALFGRAFGWENMAYITRNVTSKKPRPDDLPAWMVETIREYNAVDLDLYAYAVDRFEQLLREYDITDADVERVRDPGFLQQMGVYAQRGLRKLYYASRPA